MDARPEEEPEDPRALEPRPDRGHHESQETGRHGLLRQSGHAIDDHRRKSHSTAPDLMPESTEGTTLDIGRVLVEQDYITQPDLDRAAAAASEQGMSLQEALLDQGTITRPLLGQSIAEYLKVPFADLQSRPLSVEQVQRIPEDVARKFNVVAFNETDDEVTVATDEQDHAGMTAALRGVFGEKRLVRAYALSA